MKFGIEMAYGFLDLNPDTGFQFELHAPLYAGGDMKSVQNSFSFSTDVPTTPKNQRLLRHLDRVDAKADFLRNEPVTVWSQGLRVWKALLSVTNANPEAFSVQLVMETVDMAIPLRSLALGTLRWTETDPNQWRYMTRLQGHATETLKNPHLHNHAFPMFWRKNAGNATLSKYFVNFWENVDEFYTGRNSTGYVRSKWMQEGYDGAPPTEMDYADLCPCLKLEPVLEAIFRDCGLNFVNEFQTTDELKTLYVVNTTQKIDLSAGTYNLANALPDQPAHWLLGQLIRLFNLVLTINPNTRTAKLQTVQNYVRNPRIRNDIQQYQIESIAPIETEMQGIEQSYSVTGTGNVVTITNGSIDTSNQGSDVQGKETFTSGLTVFPMAEVNPLYDATRKMLLPCVDESDGLIFLRGFRENRSRKLYPFSTSGKTAFGVPVLYGTPTVAQHSLYLKDLNAYHETVIRGKRVVQVSQKALNINALQQWSSFQKIGNQIGLPKSLSGILTKDGVQEVTWELIV